MPFPYRTALTKAPEITLPPEPEVGVVLNEDEVQQLREFAVRKPDSFRSMLRSHGVNEKSAKLLTRMYPKQSDAELSEYFRKPTPALDGKQVLMGFLRRRKKVGIQPMALGDRPSLQGAGATEDLWNPTEDIREPGEKIVPDGVVGVEPGLPNWGLAEEDKGIFRRPEVSEQYQYRPDQFFIPPEEIYTWDEKTRQWIPKPKKGIVA